MAGDKDYPTYSTVKGRMTAIADAIRDKTGGTEALTLDDMASGVNEVYEAGKKKEWSDFWDVMLYNGKRTTYYRAFANHTNTEEARAWNEATFKPKYDIRPTSMAQGFMSLDITDFEAHLQKCGVVFDSSNCTNFQQAFQSAFFTVFPTIDFSKATSTGQTFNTCYNLKTIRKIIVSETTPALSTTFSNCSKLANVVMEGSMEKSVSFSSSPLTVESMKSIISCLKDYSGTENEGTYTVTFSSACLSALDAEGNTSPNGNTWRQYAGDLGWNC